MRDYLLDMQHIFKHLPALLLLSVCEEWVVPVELARYADFECYDYAPMEQVPILVPVIWSN